MIAQIKKLLFSKNIAKEIAKRYPNNYRKNVDCCNCKGFKPRLPVSENQTKDSSFTVVFSHNDSRIEEFRSLYVDYIVFERPSQKLMIAENAYSTHLFTLTSLPVKR